MAMMNETNSDEARDEVDSLRRDHLGPNMSDETCPECPEVDPEDVEWFEHIGEGHTSVVFRGSYKGKNVAIKQMVLSAHKVLEEILAREVAIMCLVRHPNIVSLMGVVMATEPMQIIMEYCEGGAVFNLLHQPSDFTLTWAQMLLVCVQTAAAMDYLHKYDPCIIHRDLKSLNMLLHTPMRSSTDTPVVKVADMGLARALDNEQEPLTLGVGTNRWMAPEMLAKATYNEKIDVYSYGMVLYEVCCRKIPFKGVETADIRTMVLAGIRPELTNLVPECPHEMRELISRCWAHSSNRRPSFAEILSIFRRRDLAGENIFSL